MCHRMPPLVYALDHDVFGSKRFQDMNVIACNILDHDLAHEPVPTFRHHALAALTDDLMPDVTPIELGRPARRLRVNTLSRLRWLALTGQTMAVLFTRWVSGVSSPDRLVPFRHRTFGGRERRREVALSLEPSSRR